MSVVDFSCAFNTYGSLISKTGMLFREGSVFVLFLLGHVCVTGEKDANNLFALTED